MHEARARKAADKKREKQQDAAIINKAVNSMSSVDCTKVTKS
jgi:hypothetical protein